MSKVTRIKPKGKPTLAAVEPQLSWQGRIVDDMTRKELIDLVAALLRNLQRSTEINLRAINTIKAYRAAQPTIAAPQGIYVPP